MIVGLSARVSNTAFGRLWLEDAPEPEDTGTFTVPDFLGNVVLEGLVKEFPTLCKFGC